MYHGQDKLLRAPLEEVLLKLYSAPFLRWLYDVSLKPLATACPEALPPPDRSQISGADKVPKKAYIVTLLLAVFRDPELGRRFFQALPKPTREALAAVTWERRVNVAALEKALGREIMKLHPDRGRYYYEPLVLGVEHGFLVIDRNIEDPWGYYSYSYGGRTPPKKADYSVLLPAAVRQALRVVVPPPAGYELEPLDSLPAEAGSLYTCAETALTDLRLAAEYIAQGHLKYTKAERVALTSLKAVGQMTGGPEFFPGSSDSELGLLRTQLLVSGMAFAPPKEREALLTAVDSPQPVRGLVERILANSSLLHEELLPHLANRQNRWCEYNAPATRQLATCFARLPVGKWVAWDNLRQYHALREQVPTVFDAGRGELHAYAVKVGREQWSTLLRVTEHTMFELVSDPLLKGFAFLLAALGLAEIAYGAPQHPTYQRPKKPYLTPYDGLRFVRLTPLGEYVFRRRETFDVSGGLPARTPVMLDDTRLLATCRNPDALTEMALGQFMEKLAPGRYHLTPKSLVSGCRSREDIEERIRRFRRVVAAKPPAIWETFFDRTLARTAPLDLELDYVVLKVSADAEIRRLLSSEPLLRDLVLKVEGLRIAVRRADLKKLAKRLEQFGYLSPIPDLAAVGEDGVTR